MAATIRTIRFGAHNLKSAFFLVKFLEDVGYAGSRHFDAHAYRTEDHEGVKDFARGCMRTYLILQREGAPVAADAEIQALLAEINADDGAMAGTYQGAYQRGESRRAQRRHLRPHRRSARAVSPMSGWIN